MSSFSHRVSQDDFDKLVIDIINEGNTLEEAIQEAKETFTGGRINLNNIWIYETESEYKLKLQTQERVLAIEKAAMTSKPEDFVNATFALGIVFFSLPFSYLVKNYF